MVCQKRVSENLEENFLAHADDMGSEIIKRIVASVPDDSVLTKSGAADLYLIILDCGFENLFIFRAVNPQVFSLWDVRRYPWFLIYSITVFGQASPIEQTKYPSDHNVFSFQKYFLNRL